MADKPKSILVYSKQAPKLGYRLVTPQQQPLPTITKTPILPIMGGVNINVPNQVMPSQQRTPINLPMADRLINVPSPVAPVKDKSDNKKPLKWGFKGRKETDISDLEKYYVGERSTLIRINTPNKIKIKRAAKKNKYIDELIKNKGIDEAYWEINSKFKILENTGVPRELTGKMIGNNLGERSLYRMYTPEDLEGWKTGWLRYYNELTKSQKDTFDVLSEDWVGTVNELVDAAKSL
jgi:hypothetical protein